MVLDIIHWIREWLLRIYENIRNKSLRTHKLENTKTQKQKKQSTHKREDLPAGATDKLEQSRPCLAVHCLEEEEKVKNIFLNKIEETLTKVQNHWICLLVLA